MGRAPSAQAVMERVLAPLLVAEQPNAPTAAAQAGRSEEAGCENGAGMSRTEGSNTLLAGASQTQLWTGLRRQEPGQWQVGQGQHRCAGSHAAPGGVMWGKITRRTHCRGRLSVQEPHRRGRQQPLHCWGPGCQEWGGCPLQHAAYPEGSEKD